MSKANIVFSVWLTLLTVLVFQDSIAASKWMEDVVGKHNDIHLARRHKNVDENIKSLVEYTNKLNERVNDLGTVAHTHD